MQKIFPRLLLLNLTPPSPIPQPEPSIAQAPSSVGSFIPWLVAGILLVSLALVWIFSQNPGQPERTRTRIEVEPVEEVARPERETEGLTDIERENVRSINGRAVIDQIQSYRSEMSAQQLRDFHELERLRQTAVPNLVKLADGGSSWAACRLGMKYLAADDYEKANEWFQQSAKQGNAYGQLFLGIMYKEGLGISQDIAAARKFLQMSLEQDNPVAKQMLEEMGE